MTAGTDPDPAESSNAVKMPSIVQIRHMPYLDHNYGQPPPMTPPDSSSPAPDDVDTGNEDDEGNAVTRCICGFNHDDGYMICCDKCSVWQHIECMGISSENLPENYLCEQCDPRPLDRDRAKAIQSRKRDEMSDDDDDDDESAEDADGTSYTAVSNTPTRITLTAKVSHQKRKNAGLRVKGEKDKEKKQKRTKRQKQRPSADFLPVDEEANGPWEGNCSKAEYYTEVKECTYSKELEEYLMKLPQNNQEPMIPGETEQFCKVVEVQRHTKGLVTTEDLNKNQFLVKYNGKMMLRREFDEENPIFRRYNPYVLFYNQQDHIKLCVDARVMGNDARFVRRSCSPNAEVRHIVQNGKLNLVLFSLYPLPKGAEVTIPFEFSLAEYNCSLLCACAQDTCAIAKYKLKQQHVPSQELNIMEHNGHKLCDDSSNSSHNPLTTSPLRALATQNSFQGDSDSDLDNNHERSEAENRRKKLSREERKLEAYVKQIEKMEKKEKKRQAPQKEHRPVLRVSSDEGKALNKGIRGQKRLSHKRRTNGPSSGLKKKRARVSSFSSEPLSPDEVSSSASTPTTPKTVTTIPEEPLVETPSTSPSRNFRFPKTKVDENSQDGFFKTEAVSSSVLSSPLSPCSPRESETETKPTLSTASSNSDIAMECIEMEESEAGRLDDSCEVQVSLNGTTSGDLGSALSVRLAEISNVAGIESNTPSPCPSTSASPTSSESVMNGCPSVVMSGGRSPGPAPGSPLAALLHGVRVSRSNPNYYSLKKRWLCKFLSSHNGVGVPRPTNGLRTTLGILQPPKTMTLNHKTHNSKLNNAFPLPLKKRHLKYLKSSLDTKNVIINNRTLNSDVQPVQPQDIVNTRQNGPLSDTSDTKPSVNQYVSCGEEHKPASSVHCTVISNTYNEVVISSQSRTLDNRPTYTRTFNLVQNEVPSNSKSVDTTQVSHPSVTEHSIQAIVGRGTLDTVPDVKPVLISTTPVRRPSDPRLLSPSASSSQQPSQLPTSTVIQTVPISPSVTQSSDISSGTPGKKKVSLLEYRNRSLQRLSGDGSKPSQPTSSSSTSLGSSSTPSAVSVATSVVRSNSEAQPTLTSSASVKKAKNWETNGPCIEPVSPDENERLKITSITGVTTSNSPLFEAKLNSLAKKEVGMNMYNKKLSALISEQLLSDPKYSPTSSKSPSTASNSPSVPPPPPPPLDTAGKGDAMEIEEEDGPSDQKIFLATPLVSTLRTPIQPSTQPTHISEYGHPHQISEYRPSVHDQHLHTRAQNLMTPMMQPVSSQLPSHSQSRITPTPYLIAAAAATTSPAMPSQIRFPATYQNPSVQSTPYYHQ